MRSHLTTHCSGRYRGLAPRLLAAFGEQRERFAGAHELQKYSGVAPVTERSGNKRWVHWRWQCPTFLRQTFVEWAAQTINKSFWAGACGGDGGNLRVKALDGLNASGAPPPGAFAIGGAIGATT